MVDAASTTYLLLGQHVTPPLHAARRILSTVHKWWRLVEQPNGAVLRGWTQVHVLLSRREVLVPSQLLDGSCGRPAHRQMGAERVPQDVHAVSHLGTTCRPAHAILYHLLCQGAAITLTKDPTREVPLSLAGRAWQRIIYSAMSASKKALDVSTVSHGFSSYNTSRVGSPRRATCQNELVTKPGFTNYESVRFFGGRAFASCERRWNITSPLDQLRASATRLSLIERYLRSRSRLNRDPRDSSWLGVSRPAGGTAAPGPRVF